MKILTTVLLATGLLAVPVTIFAQTGTAAKDATMTPGSKGYTNVQTDKYTIEVPAGWTVGNVTPWGARDITPQTGSGKFGAMTAGPTTAGWDQLYRTSLGFIKREEPGTETPYKEGKTKQGYDCMSFEVKNKEGFTNRRYTLIRNSAGNVLALSIRIPSPDLEKDYIRMFTHMVDTAKLK